MKRKPLSCFEIWTVCLAGFGILVAAGTGVAIYWQAEISSKALNVAISADRPWIGALAVTVDPPILEGKTPKISLFSTNAGRRPARIVRFESSSKAYPVFPDDPQYLITSGGHDPSHSIIVPGLQLANIWNSAALSGPEIEAIKNGVIKFYVFGKITYQDVGAPPSDTPYTTQICYFFDRATGNYAFCPEYNDAK